MKYTLRFRISQAKSLGIMLQQLPCFMAGASMDKKLDWGVSNVNLFCSALAVMNFALLSYAFLYACSSVYFEISFWD